MKHIYLALFATALSLIPTSGWSATHYINAPRFVRPLIEKWIAEYSKINPSATFALATTAADKHNSDLAAALPEQTDANSHVVYFAEYAILPVTIKGSEAEKTLGKAPLNRKEIKQLFFINEDFEEPKKKKKHNPPVVYTGNNSQSVSHLFAAFYGHDATLFRGKRIVGDDKFLTNAINKDTRGITINALSNIFDLETRRLSSNLAILTPDVDRRLQNVLTDDVVLDDLLQALEQQTDDNIAIGKIGFSVDTTAGEVSQFLSWILTEGQQYNHHYGLLTIDADLAAEQVSALTDLQLTAHK